MCGDFLTGDYAIGLIAAQSCQYVIPARQAVDQRHDIARRYGLDNRYRGVFGRREVIFMNRKDLETRGLFDGIRCVGVLCPRT